MAEPLMERCVHQRNEPELFDRAEKALTEKDAVVEIDGRPWRVVDFVQDDAVLVLQADKT